MKVKPVLYNLLVDDFHWVTFKPLSFHRVDARESFSLEKKDACHFIMTCDKT